MMERINLKYWENIDIREFDVDGFINGVYQKYQQMMTEDPMVKGWAKTREELRSLWDKVLQMPKQGDRSLYPNAHGAQPALMEVWLKAGDFWRAGYRLGDKLICNQYDSPLRDWMIKAIIQARGEQTPTPSAEPEVCYSEPAGLETPTPSVEPVAVEPEAMAEPRPAEEKDNTDLKLKIVAALATAAVVLVLVNCVGLFGVAAFGLIAGGLLK